MVVTFEKYFQAVVRAMLMGVLLPTEDGKAILITHAALLLRDQQVPKSLFELLTDKLKLLTVYANFGCELINLQLQKLLLGAGCKLLICGHSHFNGSFIIRDEKVRLELDTTYGFAIVVNSALFSSQPTSQPSSTLLIKPGELISLKPVRAERAAEKETKLLKELEKDRRGNPRLTLRKVLTLVPDAARETIIVYAIKKALSDFQVVMTIGKIYLSVFEGDYAEKITSLISSLNEVLDASLLIRLKNELQQSVLYSDLGFNIVAGHGNNIYIKLQIPDLETLAISEPASLSANASIKEIQLWFSRQIYFNFKQRIELFKKCTDVNSLINNIETMMEQIIPKLIKQLCGIEYHVTASTCITEAQNTIAIRYRFEIPFGSGICQFVVNIFPSISFEQFEIIVTDQEACSLIQRKIASPKSAQHASTFGIFTPNLDQSTLASQPNFQPHPP